jgi:hypothetical protein
MTSKDQSKEIYLTKPYGSSMFSQLKTVAFYTQLRAAVIKT